MMAEVYLVGRRNASIARTDSTERIELPPRPGTKHKEPPDGGLGLALSRKSLPRGSSLAGLRAAEPRADS